MAAQENDVFNNVALTVETLITNGRLDESTGQRILESLINSLRINLDWDTPDEVLLENLDEPYIVQAFANCGVTIPLEN